MKKLTIEEMNRLTPEAYHQADKLPLVVVLDNVRSQHNVGAVFRTADAFRLAEVVLCGICPTPDNSAVEIHKTALGAEQTVDYHVYDDTLTAVKDLHEAGYLVLAIEQAHDSIKLPEIESWLEKQRAAAADGCLRLAIIMGHEVFGVQQAVVDACDACIEIPQYGTKHSLNVSVTAGIVMYTISQYLRKTQETLKS